MSLQCHTILIMFLYDLLRNQLVLVQFIPAPAKSMVTVVNVSVDLSHNLGKCVGEKWRNQNYLILG